MTETAVDLPVVDHHAAIRALREVVAGHEDFCYQPVSVNGYAKCVYVYKGAPSCVVGQALHRLGYPIEMLSKIDASRDTSANSLYEHLPNVSIKACDVFDDAQIAQDQGQPWRLALRAAEEQYARIVNPFAAE